MINFLVPFFRFIACLVYFQCIAYGQTLISDFTLLNTDGRSVSTKDYTDAKGFIIIFTCNHCPFAKLYTSRINALNTKYQPLNVPLLAINTMDTLVYEDESLEKMREKAMNDKMNFPYLQDAAQLVGRLFSAKYTPMAYVIWKEKNQWIVKYKGAIDDNGEHPDWATPFVENAVGELLAKNPVSLAETQTLGCRISYRKQ